MKFYKVTHKSGANLYTQYGSATYSLGARVSVDNPAPAAAGACARGLHVCERIQDTWRFTDSKPMQDLAWWEVEASESDVIASDHEKTRVAALTVTRQMDRAEVLGPNSANVDDLLTKLPSLPWFMPSADLDEGIIEQLVAQHLVELATYTQSDAFDGVTLKIVRTDAAYAAARDAAWDAAWDAARAAARAAAWDAAWDAAYAAAWDAARAAARAAAWDAARDAAYAAAWDAAYAAAWDAAYAARDAARAAAWDAARAAARAAAWDAANCAQHMIAAIPHNPWLPRVELWALGCAPVGVVDGDFLVYVPEVTQ